MRIAFTIILNGYHHLIHNDYYKKMIENFDYWIIVEGASYSNGSTSWCKEISDLYQKKGRSIDGTVEFLEKISSEHDNVILIKSNGFWKSKDEQVNVAIEEVRKITRQCFLWQVDIDEQWELEDLETAEKELIENDAKTGQFKCMHYVGKDLIAIGEWGEGPYNRLWKWSGEKFYIHEPPILERGNGKEVSLSPIFRHYSYFFEKDVRFKNDWYGGHEDILIRWIDIQNEKKFPIHISRLITGPWGNTNTFIHKI
jgi:hypothetical protein